MALQSFDRAISGPAEVLHVFAYEIRSDGRARVMHYWTLPQEVAYLRDRVYVEPDGTVWGWRETHCPAEYVEMVIRDQWPKVRGARVITQSGIGPVRQMVRRHRRVQWRREAAGIIRSVIRSVGR